MDIYQTVTDKIVAGLERAQSWQKPWTSALAADDRGAMLARPINAITKRPYRGINVWLLWATRFPLNQWATYRAWQAAGAQVRKGEKATMIVFWNRVPKKRMPDASPDAKQEHYLLARGYFVFNAAQVDGSEIKAPAPIAAPSCPVSPNAAADAFIARTGAEIRHGGDRAYYTIGEDYIQLPPREAFQGSLTSSASDAYYSTAFHELTHWSGHESRCAREFGKRFGDQAYAFEELVAELGAAYLMADHAMRFDPRPDHAAYIASWIKALQNDKRAVFTAASKAEQAVTFLGGLSESEEEEEAALAA